MPGSSSIMVRNNSIGLYKKQFRHSLICVMCHASESHSSLYRAYQKKTNSCYAGLVSTTGSQMIYIKQSWDYSRRNLPHNYNHIIKNNNSGTLICIHPTKISKSIPYIYIYTHDKRTLLTCMPPQLAVLARPVNKSNSHVLKLYVLSMTKFCHIIRIFRLMDDMEA